RNLDLDFVLESDAIAFAAELAADYGGSLQSHKPFGTSTWALDTTVAEKLSLSFADIPHHLDFARARSETYAHPTALPTVSPSDIERDLLRRDFSLNALALQLSPAQASGRLLDVCGGLGDLERKLVRVLHDRSFIDDPTRILRAWRFARRYGFEIEPMTAELIKGALPMLGRITGARVRNEMALILREPKAAEVLRNLQALGAPKNIHPAFRVDDRLAQRLNMQPQTMPRWAEITVDDLALRWNLLLAEVGPNAALAICQRLDLTQRVSRSVVATAKLVAAASVLSDASARPSEIARLLDGKPEVSLLAAWITLSPAAQKNIDDYTKRWRHLRPSISGEDLKRMGLPPGPRYKTLLETLRSAWIDGDISTLEEESAYLKELIKQDN
ncbi:MAG: CCA tRNA nucleotidyltransferase, partial [Anaerolineae bacterium]|nr:CCA tRNA nucleotidyltransferase [Anaerolineae bacterium]